ncbi:hypothetical protein [Labrenzia sp. OB1]|uniref:hypothetical protein n=1 Tax=Labrenzia sp. OB1 TaxID=1561204 RepID=UPI0007B30E28|nr:hypothetical protein [Labrenzia sp. OB1]KZM49439.1 hypothetical protein OA90_15290 [Labrenzia sp. OB1]
METIEQDIKIQVAVELQEPGLREYWRQRFKLPILDMYLKEIAGPARHLEMHEEWGALKRYLQYGCENEAALKSAIGSLRRAFSERWGEVPTFIDLRKAERWGFAFILIGFILQLIGLIFSAPVAG